MFLNRRTVFLFICSIVFVQALYYIVAFQVKKTIIYPLIPDELSSDNGVPVQNITLTSTLLRTTILLNSNNLNHTSTALIPFADASFLTSINLTQPDLAVYSLFPICHFSISNNDSSSYEVTINQNIDPYDIIENKHRDNMYSGGHWFPNSCRTEQRLAIIICYRNRELHLKLFLNNIHTFLKQQLLDYTIFVVNQHGQGQFNRAALFNVGFIEAMKLYSFNCFIFHDVDLLPEDLRNLYKCGEKPRHM
jgi:hypothetical protein